MIEQTRRPPVRRHHTFPSALLAGLALAALGPPLGAQAPAAGPAGGAPRVRLSPSGRTWVAFGGQLRERVEAWRGFNFGTPDSVEHDDVFALTRVRLSADLHLGESLRLFGEVKSAFSTNRRLLGGKRLSDVDELDLQQGFVELHGRPLRRGAATAVRLGRQELALGRERLVSPLDWSNARRTFDGLVLTGSRQRTSVTTFLLRPVRQERYRFNPWDEHRAFFGAYYSAATPRADRRMDAYWLGLSQDAAAVNGTVGSERRQTLGLRLSGKGPGGLGDYDLEAAYQFGSLGNQRINAWMAAALVGRSLWSSPSAPRVWLGLDYASGDKSPGGSVQTFNQLFPLGHAYLGYVDAVGRQNVVDASAGVSWTVRAPLAVNVDGHRFWRASANDGLYGADGSVVRAGGAGASRDVGMELDIVLRYSASAHFTLLGGYSRFVPGAFIKESGSTKTVESFYLSLQYTI